MTTEAEIAAARAGAKKYAAAASTPLWGKAALTALELLLPPATAPVPPPVPVPPTTDLRSRIGWAIGSPSTDEHLAPSQRWHDGTQLERSDAVLGAGRKTGWAGTWGLTANRYTKATMADAVANTAYVISCWGVNSPIAKLEQQPARPWTPAFTIGLVPSDGSLAEGNTGAYDQHIDAIGRAFAAAGITNPWINLMHEFSGTINGSDAQGWYPWYCGTSVAKQRAFRDYYRRCAARIRAICPGAKFALMAAYDTACNWFENAYPGDDVVDAVGLDFYGISFGSPRAGGGKYAPPADPQAAWDKLYNGPMGLRDVAAFADLHGKPIVLGEWSVWADSGLAANGGGDWPLYVDKMADFIRDRNVLYAICFSIDLTGIAGPNHDMVFDKANFPASNETLVARFGA